jgi:modulator of FtsH protease HflK
MILGYNMAWNEPGGGKRDPWSGGNRDQGPPDLDEVIRKLAAKFSMFIGGKRDSGKSSNGGAGPGLASVNLAIGIITLCCWLIASIYIVEEGKRGVVLRFGRYLETTMPGPHLRIFPIDRVEIVNVEQRRFREIGYRSGNGNRQAAIRSVLKESLMLTKDENIVDVRLAVQYQVSDPRDYLFNVFDIESVLVQVVESAARETIGKSSMSFILTEGRSDIVSNIKLLSQQVLDSYMPALIKPASISEREQHRERVNVNGVSGKGSGLRIINVVLQDAQPPEEVQEAFADTIKAREDEQRLKDEAGAYANEVIPKARGQAARRLQEAAAYKEQVIAQAQGEASRFDRLLDSYKKAPSITRERLYLETLEGILSRTSKVMVDTQQGTKNLVYLPLDRILKYGESAPNSVGNTGVNTLGDTSTTQLPSTDNSATTSRARATNRSREAH